VPILAKRPWSSFTWTPHLPAPGDGEGECEGGGLGEAELAALRAPMPNAGTDTPAAPSLLTASPFSPPLAAVLGGNRGGRLGGALSVVASLYDGGLVPFAPSLRAGGLGKPAVDKDVVFMRYGLG
jgi:hypothetical protein